MDERVFRLGKRACLGTFRGAQQISSGRQTSWRVKGGVKEDDKAISDFTKAIELDPDNARYYSSRGASYERLEEYDEAISDATKAIELDSEDADSYSTRGSSYDKLGAHEKAISDYTKALELDPEDDNGKISDRVRQLRDPA